MSTTSNRACVVLVPVARSIERPCEDGLRELERRGYEVRRVYGYSAIDQGRCQIVTDALAEDFEETFWIDSDIGFNADDVERIRSHNLPICCAIYPQKSRRALAAHNLPGSREFVFGKQGGLTEICYTGFGFIHIRREVYAEMGRKLRLPICNMRFGRPMIPFFLPMVIEDNGQSASPDGGLAMPDIPASGPGDRQFWYLSEDYSFCERARRCGFRIMADTTIRLFHYGNYGYSWEDAGNDVKRFGTYKFEVRPATGG